MRRVFRSRLELVKGKLLSSQFYECRAQLFDVREISSCKIRSDNSPPENAPVYGLYAVSRGVESRAVRLKEARGAGQVWGSVYQQRGLPRSIEGKEQNRLISNVDSVVRRLLYPQLQNKCVFIERE